MFFTIQSFTYFFWILGGLILLMLIFEDKLLALEAKYDKKKQVQKRAKMKAQYKATAKNSVKSTKKPQTARINSNCNRAGNYYAA